MASTLQGINYTNREICKGGTRLSLAQHIDVNRNGPSKVEFNCRFCIRHTNNRLRLNDQLLLKICTICKTTFSTQRETPAHEPIHIGELPKKCSVCGKQFKLHSKLISHKERKHKRTIQCICNLKFHTIAEKYAHVKRAHFWRECSLCNERIERNRKYELNMSKHKIECYTCKKRFPNLGELKIHSGSECCRDIKRVERKDDANTFVCKMCDYLVKNLDSIRRYFPTSCTDLVKYSAQYASYSSDDTTSPSSSSTAASLSTQHTSFSDNTSAAADETFV